MNHKPGLCTRDLSHDATNLVGSSFHNQIYVTCSVISGPVRVCGRFPYEVAARQHVPDVTSVSTERETHFTGLLTNSSGLMRDYD